MSLRRNALTFDLISRADNLNLVTASGKRNTARTQTTSRNNKRKGNVTKWLPNSWELKRVVPLGKAISSGIVDGRNVHQRVNHGRNRRSQHQHPPLPLQKHRRQSIRRGKQRVSVKRKSWHWLAHPRRRKLSSIDSERSHTPTHPYNDIPDTLMLLSCDLVPI